MNTIEILYRDRDVLLVNKPSGLLTHRSELANDSDVAMMRARDTVGQYVYPVHRLDRGTSGALAFGLSETGTHALRHAFDEGRVIKVYIALVRGEFPESAHVDYAVPKCEGGERVAAVTEFRRLACMEFAGIRCSLVEARPKTGRFHQIRRHLSHLRFPIAGDTNYGTGWFNRWAREPLLLPRLALHAFSFAVPDLVREIEAPLDATFVAALTLAGVTPETLARYQQRCEPA
jgi:tRNA pseudouridine65 synthase